MEESEWGGVYCHLDGPQCGRFAQGPSVASSSPHQYNSWGGTIVWVTDKAFTLDCSGHLSQGDSKETSLSTNGGGKVLCSLSFFTGSLLLISEKWKAKTKTFTEKTTVIANIQTGLCHPESIHCNLYISLYNLNFGCCSSRKPRLFTINKVFTLSALL